MEEAGARLVELAEERGETLLGLSRLIGRNDAYLQQFVRRGSPRRLAERDRAKLASYLAVDEAELGGDARRPVPLVAVPRADVAASAGPGRLVEDEGVGTAALLDPALLRALGVRPGDASLIAIAGDSMAPLLAHGDEVLVNRAACVPDARGGIYVVRLDGLVMVKRVARRGGTWQVTSDNPAHPSPGAVEPERLAVLGRVVWQSRML